MTRKTSREYLVDIVQELDDIIAFVAGDPTRVTRDVLTRKAVIRSYEVIGEISKRLPDSLRDRNPQVGWRTLIGFRDFLSHHYEEVIIDNLATAVQDAPRLRADIQHIIENLDNPD
jgi:uncharacterized protein with HEPN domain